MLAYTKETNIFMIEKFAADVGTLFASLHNSVSWYINYWFLKIPLWKFSAKSNQSSDKCYIQVSSSKSMFKFILDQFFAKQMIYSYMLYSPLNISNKDNNKCKHQN